MTDEIPQAQPPPALRPTRLWCWRRNPLRHPTDLVQAWIGLAVTLAVLPATPLAMLLVGTTVHRSLQQIADEQARTRHRTTAVLLRDAPPPPRTRITGRPAHPLPGQGPLHRSHRTPSNRHDG